MTNRPADHPAPVPAAPPAPPSRAPAAAAPAHGPSASPHLFTADEIPQPPDWMRRPPSEEADGETLFAPPADEPEEG